MVVIVVRMVAAVAVAVIVVAVAVAVLRTDALGHHNSLVCGCIVEHIPLCIVEREGIAVSNCATAPWRCMQCSHMSISLSATLGRGRLVASPAHLCYQFNSK